MLVAVLLVVYYGHRYSLPASSEGYWWWFKKPFFFEYRNGVLGFLLAFPLVYAAFSLGWKRALGVVVCVLVAVAPYVLDLCHGYFTALTSMSLMVIPSLVVMSWEIKTVSDTRERLAQEEKRRQRVEIVRQQLRAQEDERKRIAQELHDGVMQTLLVTATSAHNLLERGAAVGGRLTEELRGIRDNCLALVSELRAICQGLRPSIVDTLGFVSAVKWLADSIQEESGLRVAVTVTGETSEPAAEVRLALFRMVQEALNNVTKHAKASSVCLRLDFQPKEIRVEIEDDGQGFATLDDWSKLAAEGKLGILGMTERALAIGARVDIRSSRGAGTVVRIASPYEA